MRTVVAIICCLVAMVNCHSWMTCPPSFNAQNGRGGEQTNACENNGNGATITHVEAGDRLKVGWTSNNHAGGYVRLSLVPFGQHWGASAEGNFKNNVLKFACYGHDGRKGGNNGDCIHPCGARPGCQYQSDTYDDEKYETTIGIPTNLPDGDYVLQAAMLVGNAQKPYYSCGKIRIIKGNTGLRCSSNQEPLTYQCVKTGGPVLASHFLRSGAQSGPFCYHFDGRVGTTDDTIYIAPINVECDSRMTCDNSVNSGTCFKEPRMDELQRKNGQSILPGCNVASVLPPPQPTCTDGVRNRDEERIDCGGQFCVACPILVKPGEYFGSVKQEFVPQGTWTKFVITTSIIKTITEDQCWRMVLQYQHPLQIVNIWGDGVVITTNNQKTIITLGGERKPTAGTFLTFTFQATNPNTDVSWNKENMELQGATHLYVYDNLTCQE